jgi:hypothetical protein
VTEPIGDASTKASPAAAKDGPGAPKDALGPLEQQLLKAIKASPTSTADPRVSAAFALGWQMAELYRPQNLRKHEPLPDDLPGLGSLDKGARVGILIDQVRAGVSKLKNAIESAGLTIPDTAPLKATVGNSQQERQLAILTLHRELLGALTAADYRLGKAYGLGRALADTCLKPHDASSLREELKPQRLANLLAWLDELHSALPAHSGKSVAASLERWRGAVAHVDAPDAVGATLSALRHQGQLWRALLSGEKDATTMLEIDNYLDAARDLASRMSAVVRGVIRRFPVQTGLVGLLSVAGVVLLARGGSSELVAGVTSILAALGVTWKGLGGAVGQLAGRVEQPLWGAALDIAITDAITLLPDNAADHRGRRALALELPVEHLSHAVSNAGP